MQALHLSSTTMALAVTVSFSVGARLLHIPRKLAPLTTPFRQTWSFSKMGSNNLQLGTSVPARKLVVRAARTESEGVSLGFRAPHFELPEPCTGKVWKLEDFEPYPALLVMFICNHCPFVKHLKKDIVKLANFYMKKGLAVVAISSNSVATHPQDGPQFMAEEAKQFNYPFPYLYDESQDVAREFRAVCTPEFFLFKKGLKCGNRLRSQQPTSTISSETQCWMQHKVASRDKSVICDHWFQLHGDKLMKSSVILLAFLFYHFGFHEAWKARNVVYLILLYDNVI
ncbi:uncharacterized protein LOC132184475 isoform X2 [Corylus avellana]|uniref:uncharacterized protein LOC132184475 isoform X2 n=1 Tax=Corylus avellana TaxID=13451 RepID=UPI00286A8EF4|nr:uncharacterized protein LOC132184475 isoform X2 [Corylus avellana]